MPCPQILEPSPGNGAMGIIMVATRSPRSPSWAAKLPSQGMTRTLAFQGLYSVGNRCPAGWPLLSLGDMAATRPYPTSENWAAGQGRLRKRAWDGLEAGDDCGGTFFGPPPIQFV